MKKIYFLIAMFAVLNGSGQDIHKLLSEVKSIKVHNIGPIKSGDNIKGYFSFYEYDKADKKNIVFKLNIMDENLNLLGTKDITGPKNLQLMSSAYDGKYFCFKFWDGDAQELRMQVYDQEGQNVVNNVEHTKYDPNNMNNYFYQAASAELGVAEGHGFVNYSFHSDDKGFFINYADGNTKHSWNKVYEPLNSLRILTPTYLTGNKDLVLTGVAAVSKGADGKKGGNFLVANSIADGSVLFNISTDVNGLFVTPVSATIEGDKISVVGLKFPSANMLMATPEGVILMDVDKKGQVLNTTVKRFDEIFGRGMPIENHRFVDGNFPYIHEVHRTSSGNTIVFAAKFKNAFMSGLTLNNFIVVELDKNLKIVQVKEITKEAESAPSVMFFGSYFSINYAKMNGQIDYLYMTKSDEDNEVTFSYVEREERAKKGVIYLKNFGQVRYKNGKITSDKIAIKDANSDRTPDNVWLYPAKSGYVLKASYFRKSKELAMDFIKLN